MIRARPRHPRSIAAFFAAGAICRPVDAAAVDESMRQQTVEALQQILAAQRWLPFPGLIERNDLAFRVYE